MRTAAQRFPQRGEIWWTSFHTDPPEKGRRPVVIVSPNARNQHERATTVLVVPLSASVHKLGPAHLLLDAGETGLRMDCAAEADNIAVVVRDNLREPEPGQRSLTNTKICKLASLVKLAMGCPEPTAML
ncbi:MAG TPA: type II toxin-antitoxin system PemK/MazF family toxin [Terracidiphilus sp.]|nr:type II toxin-antitoxin system PemK/MazF family toxin [Terracidiphilus sp.]